MSITKQQLEENVRLYHLKQENERLVSSLYNDVLKKLEAASGVGVQQVNIHFGENRSLDRYHPAVKQKLLAGGFTHRIDQVTMNCTCDLRNFQCVCEPRVHVIGF